LGRERARALEPSSDPTEVAGRLAITSEAAAFLKAGGSLGLDAPDDLPAALASLDVEANALDPMQLLALARFLSSVRDVAAAIRRAHAAPGAAEAGSCTRLAAIAAGAATFDDGSRRSRQFDP